MSESLSVSSRNPLKVGEFLPRTQIPLPILREKYKYIKGRLNSMDFEKIYKQGYKELDMQTTRSKGDRFFPQLDSAKDKVFKPTFNIRNFGYLCEKNFLDDSNYHRRQMLGNKNASDFVLKIPKLKTDESGEDTNSRLLERRGSDFAYNSDGKKPDFNISQELRCKNSQFHCDMTGLRDPNYRPIGFSNVQNFDSLKVTKFSMLKKKGYKRFFNKSMSEPSLLGQNNLKEIALSSEVNDNIQDRLQTTVKDKKPDFIIKTNPKNFSNPNNSSNAHLSQRNLKNNTEETKKSDENPDLIKPNSLTADKPFFKPTNDVRRKSQMIIDTGFVNDSIAVDLEKYKVNQEFNSDGEDNKSNDNSEIDKSPKSPFFKPQNSVEKKRDTIVEQGFNLVVEQSPKDKYQASAFASEDEKENYSDDSYKKEKIKVSDEAFFNPHNDIGKKSQKIKTDGFVDASPKSTEIKAKNEGYINTVEEEHRPTMDEKNELNFKTGKRQNTYSSSCLSEDDHNSDFDYKAEAQNWMLDFTEKVFENEESKSSGSSPEITPQTHNDKTKRMIEKKLTLENNIDTVYELAEQEDCESPSRKKTNDKRK